MPALMGAPCAHPYNHRQSASRTRAGRSSARRCCGSGSKSSKSSSSSGVRRVESSAHRPRCVAYIIRCTEAEAGARLIPRTYSPVFNPPAPCLPCASPRPQPEVHLPAAKRRKQREREELEELEHDYALLRKLKKGKITAREYDVAAGLSSDDEAAA